MFETHAAREIVATGCCGLAGSLPWTSHDMHHSAGSRCFGRYLMMTQVVGAEVAASGVCATCAIISMQDPLAAPLSGGRANADGTRLFDGTIRPSFVPP